MFLLLFSLLFGRCQNRILKIFMAASTHICDNRRWEGCQKIAEVGFLCQRVNRMCKEGNVTCCSEVCGISLCSLCRKISPRIVRRVVKTSSSVKPYNCIYCTLPPPPHKAKRILFSICIDFLEVVAVPDFYLD
jgi:hypothetical protein